jgi:MSHA biogenesis protein MshM
MYEVHFGLREPPFGITPDTSFAFSATSHQEALNTLLMAANSGEGFIKISGEVGTGKTMLCRRFLAALDERFITAYIPNPLLEPKALMHTLARELEVRTAARASQEKVTEKLGERLVALSAAGKRVLICLDEAQAIPHDTLEALRLLSNLETEKRKMLQVVLFGQPELDERLAQDSLRQLRQRITFEYTLAGLTEPELLDYLAHRLHVAGYTGKSLFTRGAVDMLYRATRGVPRLINILTHKALLLVYAEGGRMVTQRHTRAAVQDTPSVRRSRAQRYWDSLLLSLPSARR